MTWIRCSYFNLSESLIQALILQEICWTGELPSVQALSQRINHEKPLELIKLEKKVKCGADFIQTQAVYDVGMFEEFMEAISHIEVPIIAGLIPLKSLGMAKFMNENISGISVPDEIMFCMREASNPIEEGLSIASETIKELMKLSRGVHIMPIGSHRNTPRLLSMAGISGDNS